MLKYVGNVESVETNLKRNCSTQTRQQPCSNSFTYYSYKIHQSGDRERGW